MEGVANSLSSIKLVVLQLRYSFEDFLRVLALLRGYLFRFRRHSGFHLLDLVEHPLVPGPVEPPHQNGKYGGGENDSDALSVKVHDGRRVGTAGGLSMNTENYEFVRHFFSFFDLSIIALAIIPFP